jgi:hypothetical protein
LSMMRPPPGGAENMASEEGGVWGTGNADEEFAEAAG